MKFKLDTIFSKNNVANGLNFPFCFSETYFCFRMRYISVGCMQISFFICLFSAMLICLYLVQRRVSEDKLSINKKDNKQIVMLQIKDYAQKMISLIDVIGKDKYLKKLKSKGKILEYQNGSIEILSNPMVRNFTIAKL